MRVQFTHDQKQENCLFQSKKCFNLFLGKKQLLQPLCGYFDRSKGCSYITHKVGSCFHIYFMSPDAQNDRDDDLVKLQNTAMEYPLSKCIYFAKADILISDSF